MAISSGGEPPVPATRKPVRGRRAGGRAIARRSPMCRRAALPAGGERAAAWAEPRPAAALGAAQSPSGALGSENGRVKRLESGSVPRLLLSRRTTQDKPISQKRGDDGGPRWRYGRFLCSALCD